MGRSGLLVVLMIFAGLSGCLGDDGDPLEPDDAGNGAEPGQERDPVNQTAVLSFANNETVRVSLWENQTFSVQETGIAGGYVTGDSMHTYELTDRIPADVPVRVWTNLTWEPDAVTPNCGTGCWPELQGGFNFQDVYTYEHFSWIGDEPGVLSTSWHGLRLSEGSVASWVQAQRPQFESDAEISYTLEIDIRTYPTRIHAWQVVEVPLEPEDELIFRSLDDPADVRIYGPQDEYVANVHVDGETRFRVPPETGAGNYVFAPNSDGGNLTFLRTNGTATLRAITEFTFIYGEWRDAGNEASWTFDLENPPLHVGIAGRDTEDPHESAPVMSMGVNGTLTYPGGEQIHGQGGCLFCTGWSATVAFSPMGDPRIAPGTYEAGVISDFALGMEVTEIEVWYVR